MKLLLQPLPVRIFHWTMVVCVVTLLCTGFYLNNPLDVLHFPLRIVRKVHSLFGVILIFNLTGHMYYYLVTKKFTEIVFLPRDLSNLRSFARYALFITDGHPNFGRYNPGQKLLFTLWWLTVLGASFTSMLLLFPDSTAGIWGQRLLGGLNRIRIVHYMVAVIFASSIPFHLYLVFTEDPAKLQAMFTGYVNKDSRESHRNKASTAK